MHRFYALPLASICLFAISVTLMPSLGFAMGAGRVLATPDLAVSISVPITILVGNVVPFRFEVENLSNKQASNVQLSIDLPLPGIISQLDSRCALQTGSNEIVICQLDRVKSRSPVEVEIDYIVQSATGETVLSAEVSSDSAEDNMDNNYQQVDLNIQGQPGIPLSAGDQVYLVHCTQSNITSVTECRDSEILVAVYRVTLQADGTVQFPDFYPHTVLWSQSQADISQVAVQYLLRGNSPTHSMTLSVIDEYCFAGTMTWVGYNGLLTAYELCKYPSVKTDSSRLTPGW